VEHTNDIVYLNGLLKPTNMHSRAQKPSFASKYLLHSYTDLYGMMNTG
jgi:hypothetical protein